MIVKSNKSVFDVSTQAYGDVRSAVDFAIANNLSLTQDLEPSSEYKEAQTNYVNQTVQSFFFNVEQELATGTPTVGDEAVGIGVMIVGSNFDIT